jgi:hypothetical protein
MQSAATSNTVRTQRKAVPGAADLRIVESYA